ncbi:MAG TPA: hypothetical protein VFR59_02055 [Steroidobacteraceae bacterium]|nr:hypothetical protein [Steroidobacteraceae bacterium]
MAGAEHILLESDEREVPADLRAARKLHARVRLRTGLLRRRVELALADYYYLGVRTWRTRGTVTEHVLDLRFIQPTPHLSTHVPWRSIGVAALLSLLCAGAFWWIGSAQAAWWEHPQFPATAILLGMSLGAWLVSAYRTTRTLTLRSVHGHAKVLELTGHLGSLRALRRFSQLLAAHLRAAIRARRKSRAEHLRDEMREHFRLKEAGVLSEEEYESGKARILATHAPAA